MPDDPWKRLKELLLKLAESFAVSYQIVVVGIVLVFVVIIGFLMALFGGI